MINETKILDPKNPAQLHDCYLLDDYRHISSSSCKAYHHFGMDKEQGIQIRSRYITLASPNCVPFGRKNSSSNTRDIWRVKLY